MAWQHALSPGRRELGCVPGGDGLAPAAIRLTLRVRQGPAFSGREPVGGGAAGLSYCEGGREDPGQLVTVSPVEATFQTTTSLP